MAAEPSIKVNVEPDLSKVKTLLQQILNVIKEYEQQGNEAEKN